MLDVVAVVEGELVVSVCHTVVCEPIGAPSRILLQEHVLTPAAPDKSSLRGCSKVHGPSQRVVQPAGAGECGRAAAADPDGCAVVAMRATAAYQLPSISATEVAK